MFLIGGTLRTNLFPVLINFLGQRSELVAHFIETLSKPYPVVGHDFMELHRGLPRMHKRSGSNVNKFGVNERHALYITQLFRRS